MADGVPILYQAEWCPFSSAVREALTELGVDYTIRQVPPDRGDRDELKAVAGTDQIPVFQAADGELHRGWRAIFRHLRDRDPWQYAAAHRRQFADHAEARESDVPGRLIEYFRGTGELEAALEEQQAEPEVTDVPDRSRYELRLGGKLIGLAAYRKPAGGGIVFTHTEVDESCEGRGYGTLVVRTALDAARAEGLQVVPLCPFVARVIERHPEYGELVAASRSGG